MPQNLGFSPTYFMRQKLPSSNENPQINTTSEENNSSEKFKKTYFFLFQCLIIYYLCENPFFVEKKTRKIVLLASDVLLQICNLVWLKGNFLVTLCNPQYNR